MNTIADEIKIRKAREEDLAVLHKFEQGVIEEERNFDPTLKKEQTVYYDLKEMIHSPRTELVVAEINNKVIASGYARIEKSKDYLQHERHAYLGFMFVVPEFRGKGINKAIIETLTNWARLQNVNE